MSTRAAAKKKPVSNEAAEVAVDVPAPVIVAYKALDENFRCRGFQYEVGQTYALEGDPVRCERGFHACENPLDVLSYYSLTESRFAAVELSGKIDRDDSDTKIASAQITIKAELKLPDFIKAAIDWMFAKAPKVDAADESVAVDSGNASRLAASGNASRLAASGYASRLAASGNDSSLAASGYDSRLAASGNASRLAASGNASRLAASGYDSSLAASGYDSSLAASGNDSRLAASGNDSRLAASGNDSRLAASGNDSRLAASGYDSSLAASGYDSSLAASGLNSRVKMGPGGCATVAWHDGTRIRFATAYVGEDGIEAEIWYRVRDGKFVKCEG